MDAKILYYNRNHKKVKSFINEIIQYLKMINYKHKLH